jgi:hypothetical protein
LLLLTLSLAGLTTPLQLAAAPGIAADLAFTQLVTVGQGGFTEATGPQGINDRVVFAGTRNGSRTLYLYDDGVFIEVLPADGTLPGGMGTASTFTAGYRMVPNGDIIFRANVSGGSLPAGTYTFRWHNGTITVQPEAGANINYMTSDGRWLVEEESGIFPTNTFDYFLTDGSTKEPLIRLTGLDSACDTTRFKVHAANASGVVAYTEIKIQKSVCAIGSPTFLTEWSLRLGGSISQTLLSGSFTTRFGTSIRAGSGVNMVGSILNDSNELLMILETYDGVTGNTQKQNVVLGSGGGVQRVLFDTSDPQVFAFLPPYFDGQGRIAVVGFTGSFNGPRTLLRGDTDNPAQDFVLQEGVPLFGSTLSLLQPAFSGYQDSSIPGENRGFYFTYDLADGTKGIGLASRMIPHWANPVGGSWDTAVNWTPIGVPATTTEVVFDLPNTYAVTLGDQLSGGVTINKGDVTFRNGSLTVNPFNLAVVGLPGGDVPRLTIGETGSSTQITANVQVGPGDLRLNNAFVVAPDGAFGPGTVELGVFGPATATVTGGSTWNWQSMRVGAGHPAQLRLEQGAFVGNAPAQEMIIGGGAVVNNGVARVTVDDAGNNPGPLGLGTALGASILDLTIGQGLVGELAVTNGGSVFAINASVGTMDHGNRTDGSILVSGVNASRPSLFEAGNNVANNGGLFAAAANGTDAQIEVVDGGLMRVTFLSLASAPQSSALMFVDGANGARRSTLLAPLAGGDVPAEPNPAAGFCLIGHAGQGTLNVSNGGLVECRNIAVGYLPGSRGEINAGGSSGAFTAQVIARGTATGDGLICIGSVTACGQPGTGAQGDVTLTPGGILEGDTVLVGSNGRIRGSGTVVALQGVHLVGGTVSPGVTVLSPTLDGGGVAPGIGVLGADPAPSGTIRRALAPTPIGTLSVQGGVTFGPGSQLVLEVGGAAPGAFDSLVVTGAATLGGQLTLDFVDGFLPRRGDTFRLVQAGSVLGAFAAVVATGLPAGYEYEVTVLGGEVRLTITCVPIALSPATLPGGTVGTPYSQTLTASGGVEPYGFAVTGGALPDGLTLTPAGALEGTPTEGGSFGFTVTATDPGPCAASRAYTLTIAANGAGIASVNPGSGPTTGGQPVTVTGSGLAGATSVTFGGVAGTITSNTDTLVTVTTPPHAPGVVDVVVATPGGPVTAAAAYTYVMDAVAVPTASTLALILFAAALAGVALLRLR